jgi:hypothetical protein
MDKLKNYNQFTWAFDAFLKNSDNSFDSIERLSAICDEMNNLEIENIAHRATLEIYELIHLPNNNAERLIETITLETNEIKSQIDSLIKKHKLNHADIMPNVQFWFGIIDSFNYFLNFFTKRGIIKSVDVVLAKNKEIGLIENNKNKAEDDINTTLLALEYDKWLTLKKVSEHDFKLKNYQMVVESDYSEFLRSRNTDEVSRFIKNSEDILRSQNDDDSLLSQDILDLHLAIVILGLKQNYNFWHTEKPKVSHIEGVLKKFQMGYKEAVKILENRKESFAPKSNFSVNVIDEIINYLERTKFDFEYEEDDFEEIRTDENSQIKFNQRENLFNMLYINECVIKTRWGAYKYSLLEGGVTLVKNNNKIRRIYAHDADNKFRKVLCINGVEVIQRNQMYTKYQVQLGICFTQFEREIESNYYILKESEKSDYLNDISKKLKDRLSHIQSMLEYIWKVKPLKENLPKEFIDYITKESKCDFEKIDNSEIGILSLFFRTNDKFKDVCKSLNEKEKNEMLNFSAYYNYDGLPDKQINLFEIQIEEIKAFLGRIENDSKYKVFLNDTDSEISEAKNSSEFNNNYWNIQCYNLFLFLSEKYEKNGNIKYINIYYFLKDKCKELNTQYRFTCRQLDYRKLIFDLNGINITKFQKAQFDYFDKELPKLNEIERYFRKKDT